MPKMNNLSCSVMFSKYACKAWKVIQNKYLISGTKPDIIYSELDNGRIADDIGKNTTHCA